MASGICSASHSSFSRTSMITAAPVLDLSAASVGEISTISFFASATNLSKPACSAMDQYAAGHTPLLDLFIAKRLDGVEGGGFSRGIKAEKNSNRCAEQKRNCNGTE